MSVTARVRRGPLWGAALILLMAVCPAFSMSLEFPWQATPTVSRSEALTSYGLPLGPWGDDGVPVRRIEGARTDRAWRIAAPGLTTLELLAPLREQVVAQGYQVIWECETRACGGFDFRFAIDVLNEPDMHVDLGDFRFLAAERAGLDGPVAISLLVSRSGDTGFVQMIAIGGPAPSIVAPVVADPGEVPAISAITQPGGIAEGSIGRQLETGGAVALDDLTFESGSARLGPGGFPSLEALAAYLKANPERTVALVGHTDASGPLAVNIALSTARAASVRERLIRDHGIPQDRVEAEGVGYLAPRATNLTEEGRARNRRVEVILISTQ